MWLTRFLLYVILFMLLARAVRRFMQGLAQGMGTDRRAPGPPEQGVRMVRDPICGTYVVPAKALALRDGKGVHHFCSDKCRDAFIAQARR